MKLFTTAKFSGKDLDTLKALAPGLEVVRELDAEKAREHFRDAEIFCGFQLPGPLSEARALRWVQLTSAGAEHIFDTGILLSDALVTTASGVHAHSISEYVLSMMVMLGRRFPEILAETARHEWRPQRQRTYYGEELHGKTVGVLGLGAIGQQVATVSRCLGMRVLGTRRSRGEGVADEVFTPDRLLEMLPRCDFVVVTLPLTPETRGLVGERELRAMKPTAYLVNVARGNIVDESALVRALRDGWIAGAAFDVFAQEPLPPDSELWALPNLIVTPHMAGNFAAYLDRVMDILRENLRRYLAGEPLINLLDKQRGY